MENPNKTIFHGAGQYDPGAERQEFPEGLNVLWCFFQLLLI